MIYLDNAATSYPKPLSVIRATERALLDYGANPGRAGHRLSLETSLAVYRAREKCAEFFGAETENTVFTLNCTHSLNFAIKGVCAMYNRPHIITTDLEHNSVIRPVNSLKMQGLAEYSIANSGTDDYALFSNIKNLIKNNTRLIVMTAGCNVDGRKTPLKQVAELCAEKGICFIVDAAQGAGVIPLSLKDGINIICAPGHKGLYGTMGTGVLVTDGIFPLKSFIEGGTGSASTDIIQPDFLPDMLESGTINTPGAIALGSGIDFVLSKGIEKIFAHETSLCEKFLRYARLNEKIKIYRNETADYLPVVSFNVDGVSASEAVQKLSSNGIYLRGGFHCNFLAHKKLGTEEGGTVRFAPSVFNSSRDIARFCSVLTAISR